MRPVVFLEKVRRPDPRGLTRERLEEHLLAAGSPPLGVVLGPPGSGKSTLLGRVAARSSVPAAWYRVSEEDSTEDALIRHLAHAVSHTLPPGSDAAHWRDAASLEQLLTALEDAAQPDLLLVVDDLHEIAGTAAEKALERFITLRPRRVRMLLGSRRPPALNTSRLLVSGELGQLDGDDLRFRSWEVEELFRTVYAQPLSPETAAALTRRTGGWAAGLQLFHLATVGLNRADRERAVGELSGRSRLIRSYLARNVLDGLPDSRRSFLVRTCALGVLTGDNCDALLQTTGSAAVLDDLEQQQFFTTSTDGGQTFRYHQVLQTHLEIVLADEIGAAGARRLYSASARLLEDSGRVAAAVRAHARAEDWGSVARLLHHSSPSSPAADDAVWNGGRLPGAPSDDPSLMLAGARRLMRHGLVAEAVAAFAQAESLMDDPDFRARCADQRMQAALWLPQVAATSAPGPTSRALRVSTELRRATLAVRDPAANTTGLGRGVAHLLAGDIDAAGRVLRAAQADPDLLGWEGLALRLAAQLCDLRQWPTETTGSELEALVLSADVEGLPWVARVARGLQAALQLAVAPTPWRVDAGLELLEDCERAGDQWTLCLLGTVLGAAYAFAGQHPYAVAPLRRSEEAAGELGAPVLQVWATAFRTAIATHLGDPQGQAESVEVARWARALGVEGAARLFEAGGLRFGPRVGPAVTAGPAAPAPEPEPDPAALVGGATVQLQCLGSFALTVAGRAASWDELRPRARWVLMILALHHGRDVHRETLVDALWPDATLTGGVRSLQVAVSSVRQCLAAAGLPESSLRRHGDAYALDLAATGDDLRDFDRLVRQGTRLAGAGHTAAALEARLAALDLYSGDLLPEVGPAEWVVEERDRLRAVAARVGAEAAQLALELGDLSAGRQAAQRSVELDPYHDIAWRMLATSHERLGDRSAAAVTRREHARLCADLGLESGLPVR